MKKFKVRYEITREYEVEVVADDEVEAGEIVEHGLFGPFSAWHLDDSEPYVIKVEEVDQPSGKQKNG